MRERSRVPCRASYVLSALVLPSLVCGATPAFAQARTQQPEAELPVLVGVLVGPERLPKGMVGSPCGSAVGSTVVLRTGAYVQVPVGPLTLEGGSALHTDGPELVCAGRLMALDGVHTTREARMRQGDFVSTQVAVLLSLGGTHRAVVAAGAGWTWPKDVPYVTGGLGFHVGRGLQVGVDLGLRLYRVPWTLHTAEYVSGQQVRVISDESYEDWMRAFTVQFSVAFPVLRL